MTRTDAGESPDFSAMSNPNFFDAHTEFMRLASEDHPHRKLWREEAGRRHEANAALRCERSPYFTAGYLAQSSKDGGSGTALPIDSPAGIPLHARPWDIARAVLPPGWGLSLLASEQADGRVSVASLQIVPLDRSGVPLHVSGRAFSIGLQEPVPVRGEELDRHPMWLDQELERRRAT